MRWGAGEEGQGGEGRVQRLGGMIPMVWARVGFLKDMVGQDEAGRLGGKNNQGMHDHERMKDERRNESHSSH